jgi:hypothetical protein
MTDSNKPLVYFNEMLSNSVDGHWTLGMAPVIPALGRQRQEDHKFEASLNQRLK